MLLIERLVSHSPGSRHEPLTRMGAALWIAMAAGLGGCASTVAVTDTGVEIAVPSAWSVAASAQPSDLARWWNRFNDPMLGDLVTQSLKSNTDVRVAQATLRQSRALRDVQQGNNAPSLNASASVQRSQTGSADAVNTYNVGLDASWELDVFGKLNHTLNATEFDAQASQASLADVQVSIAAEVALAYIQLRGQQAQLQIARDNLASQQETLQLTQWRAQAGLVTSLEVEQAQTSTEQTAAQVPALQTSIAKSSHSLAVLTGQSPNALQALVSTPQPIPLAASDLALDIPAQTLRQRPDVRAAESRIRAALSRLSAADAARYPSFNLSGSLGLSALSLSAFNGAPAVSSLLASVTAPLLDGGAARAQVRVQEAVLEQARVNYESTVLTALQNVEDALVALSGDQSQLQRLQAAATAAANADLLARQRYASGLIDFQTVLQTQRTLLTAQDSVASTQATISADHVRLFKAMGGGWN
ncbi:efflux transporter outer membrane subunit [Rhodoferax sp. GW822-FHT02A01]|uniref:efflux transporter outer membrane subunit n=1 Tax=Rhodoferax sp. GW822-FHT02A01 TaxID=3141537 RepID=UPI00315CC97F